MADLKDIVHDAAKDPRRVSGDAGSVEMHSLQDQIAAARFVDEENLKGKKKLPIRLAKIKPGGAI